MSENKILTKKQGTIKTPRMVFIPGNVPSLKNSKIKTSRGIFSSKTVKKYITALGIQQFSSSKQTVKGYVDPNRPNKIEELRPYLEAMKKGIDEPIIMGLHHVRGSKRLFDFSNSVEIIQDLLTAHKIIEDDNVKFLFTVPMTIDGKLVTEKNKDELYSVDKFNPGVWVKFF